MTNPFYDPYRVLCKVYADGAHLKIALSEVDLEEQNRARTVKTVYGVLENDAYLSYCISQNTQKSPKQAVRILLKISLYWLIFLQKPKYMVTDTAVTLCKKLGKGGMAGFLNAFLRSFNAEKIYLPHGDEGLSIKYNAPLFFVKKVKKQYGAWAEDILGAKSHGVSVRFERGEEEYLSRPHENTPFERVYLFPNFTRDLNFFSGDYTFQSVGSIAICDAVAPCENLLDACAAPGGKSVLLSKKCKRITACELHPHRVELIKSYCERMKVQNVTAICRDSAQYCEEWAENFDGILCDVPCSGLGTLAENPDIALNKKEENIKELTEIQLNILQNCSRYLKKGGALYYSTCSILEEENDGIVQAFLSNNQEFEAEQISSPLSHEKGKFGLQFLPDTAFGAGFYIAKLRRKS